MPVSLLVSELAMQSSGENVNRLLTSGKEVIHDILHNLYCRFDIAGCHFIIGMAAGVTQEFNGHQCVLVGEILPVEQFDTLMKINAFLLIVMFRNTNRCQHSLD